MARVTGQPEGRTDTKKNTSNSGASDEDFNRRKQGFKGVFSDMMQSPEGRIAFMQMGLSMMQPRPSGQSATGQIAQSVGEGLSTLGQARIAGQEQQTAQQEADLNKQATEADIAESESRANYYQSRADAPNLQVDPTDVAAQRRQAIQMGIEAEQEAAFNESREFDWTRVSQIANSALRGTGQSVTPEELSGQANQNQAIDMSQVKPLGNNTIEYQGQQYPIAPERYQELFGNGA